MNNAEKQARAFNSLCSKPIFQNCPGEPPKRHTIQDAMQHEHELIAQCFAQFEEFEKRVSPVTELPLEKGPNAPNFENPSPDRILETVHAHCNALEALAGKIGYLREQILL
jgi:hypothetical protein